VWFPLSAAALAFGLGSAAVSTHERQVAAHCSRVMSAVEAGSVRVMAVSDWERIGRRCGRDAMLNAANSKSSVLTLGTR
jgi:hypothetical protein